MAAPHINVTPLITEVHDLLVQCLHCSSEEKNVKIKEMKDQIKAERKAEKEKIEADKKLKIEEKKKAKAEEPKKDRKRKRPSSSGVSSGSPASDSRAQKMAEQKRVERERLEKIEVEPVLVKPEEPAFLLQDTKFRISALCPECGKKISQFINPKVVPEQTYAGLNMSKTEFLKHQEEKHIERNLKKNSSKKQKLEKAEESHEPMVIEKE